MKYSIKNWIQFISISGQGFKLRVENEEVSGIFKEKAIKELGETSENVEKSLKHMREYLKGK